MNINKYKQQGFSNWQLEEIKLAYREGLSTADIDKWIAKPFYGADQMCEIRLGLLAGIDVSTYAKEGIASNEMHHIREKLLEQKEKLNDKEVKEEKEQKRLETSERRAKVRLSTLKSAFFFMPILISLFLLGIVIFYGSKFISIFTNDLYINLTTDTVTLEVGETFEAEIYIQDYSEGEDIVIDLPSIDTSQIGIYQAEYLISNEYRTKRAILTLQVVDTIAPTLTLTTDTVTITQGDEFICTFYYEVTDNYDNNVSVNCSDFGDTLGEHEVIITAIDSSSNTTEVILTVIIEEAETIIENSTTNNSSSGSSSNSSNNTSNSGNSNSNNSSSNDNSNNNNQSTSTSPYISGQLNYSVPVGTSVDDFIWLVSSNITASGTITITYSSVNLTIAGTYTFTIRSDDGASATGTVTVY